MASISVVRSASGNTGTGAPATTTADLGAVSTTGNLLVLSVSCNATVNTPSGWTLDRSQVNSNAHYVFSKYSAGEQTVVVTPTSSAAMSWWIAELSNPIASTPLAATTSTGSSTGASTRSTGTTSSTSGATNGIAIAAFGSSYAAGGTGTWSGYTNSFVETADTITTSGAATNVGLAVATVAVAADGTFECTATPSVSAKSTGIIVVYKPKTGSTVSGSASPTFALTATASGTPQVNGTASRTSALTAAAAGVPQVHGTATPTFALTAAASGKPTVQGVGTASPAFAAALAGTRVTHGTLTGTLELTATAVGSGTVSGTPTTSMRWTVVRLLITLLRAHPNLTGIQVEPGWPGDLTEKESIWVDSIESQDIHIPVFTAGRKERDDTFTVPFEIRVFGLDTIDVTFQRLLFLMAAVEDTLADHADLTLEHGVWGAEVTSERSTVALTREGHVGFGEVTVTVNTRLL